MLTAVDVSNSCCWCLLFAVCLLSVMQFTVVRLDKDNTEWLYHPRLSWQVDADSQVHWYDAVGVGWFEPRQGRSVRTHCQLLWQHSISPVSQVRQE